VLYPSSLRQRRKRTSSARPSCFQPRSGVSLMRWVTAGNPGRDCIMASRSGVPRPQVRLVVRPRCLSFVFGADHGCRGYVCRKACQTTSANDTWQV
jgi:hypothetical protein